jgi:adenosylhomocysteine nucleosidase
MMNDIAITDPCLLFALGREAHAFLQDFRPQQRFPGAPCRARFCGPEWLTVLVLETGVGGSLTKKALDWVLSKPLLGNVPYQPKVVLSAGFAGALQEELQVGDLILASEVVDPAGNLTSVPWPGPLPAGDWQPPMRRGRLLSHYKLASDPVQKKEMGRRREALAVDMESVMVASICSRREVSFGCIRVISDRVDTTISPQLLSVLSGAKVSWWRLAELLVRSPNKVGELWRLAKASRLASQQLAKALGELLTLTLSWGADL